MSSFNLDAGVQESRGPLKPRWPRAWRPYAALLSGFCGMANCWYASQRSHYIICAESRQPENADGRASRGLIMSFGTFFRYYDENLLLAATDTTIGLIGGLQAFIVLLLSFIVGRLLDAKFHRYCRWSWRDFDLAGTFLFKLQQLARITGSGELWTDHPNSESHSWDWYELFLYSQFPLRYSGEETTSSRLYFRG